MLEKLNEYISKTDAEYADIRYEKMIRTEILYNGKELSKMGSNITDGYVIRVLKNGGFATASVTKPSEIENALELATANASLLGNTRDKKTKLTIPEKIIDDVILDMDEDPREISIDKKLELLTYYNNLVLKQKDVQSTIMKYFEVYRDKYFVNTVGSKIHEPTITTGISGRIICKKNNLVQDGRVSIGSSDGFIKLKDRDEVFLKKSKIVSELLYAEPAEGGEHNIVINPSLTGVFVHEAFGHFSEADLVENSPSLLEKMQIGAKLGTEILNIIDNPTTKGQIGYYKYDDEGVLAEPVVLMEKGVLKGRLHSMQTAAAFGDVLNGHCVAEDARYEPIIRMGCIYIKPKDKKVEDLIKEAGTGYYVLDSKGGQTSGENFTFGAQYAYKIENGKLGPLVRDINIMGNLFSTLKNIVAISNGIEFCESGGCGKGQINIKSCHGGPHIFIKNAVIGGV
ncbi:TldD/PmbA family protein [bacterium]|nr:TldD/PmbA family protein [bacterium]